MNLKFAMFVVVLFLLVSSCDGRESVSGPYHVEDLIGRWVHVDRIPSGSSEEDFRYFKIESAYIFESDAAYSFAQDIYDFENENPDSILSSSCRKGTFGIVGDSLFLSNRETVSTGICDELEEDLKISGEENYAYSITITDRTLTLHYISYPADAPIQTQMEYELVD